MQLPHRVERNNKHHEIRKNIDGRSSNKQKKCINAVSFLFLSDALKKHRKHQRNAVKEIEPNHKPNRIENRGLSTLRRHKNSKKQQQNGEFCEEHGNSSNDFDIGEKLPPASAFTFSQRHQVSYFGETCGMRHRDIPHIHSISICQALQEDACESP